MRVRAAWLGALALAGCSSQSPAPPSAPSDAGTADAAPAYDFSALHDELFGGKWKTEGAVVMKDGAIVYEEYAPGWSASMRHITYSASKSVGGALVGIAIHDGLLALGDSVCKYVTPPAGADPTLCDTTIEHLVQMRSGLKWDEGYESSLTSNVNPMLYGDEADMGAYVAAQPRAKPAGSSWLYSSGDANLLARALRGALGSQDMRAWAKAKLFDPAGLTSAVFEADRSGTLVFSSSCFMTPEDLATFGHLYLDGGKSKSGAQVIPADWVTYSITAAPPVATPVPRDPDAGAGNSGGSYGAQIWLNAASPTAPPDTWLYPDVPADAFSFEGHWGQKVFVVPSRRLVVVRVGNDRDPTFDPDRMVQLAVAAVDAATQPRAATRAQSLRFAPPPAPDTVSLAAILAGFSAKETCSCAFVVGQADPYCQAFGQVSGFSSVNVAIDRSASVVTASVGSTVRTARFADAAGCTLDGLQ